MAILAAIKLTIDTWVIVKLALSWRQPREDFCESLHWDWHQRHWIVAADLGITELAAFWGPSGSVEKALNIKV